VQGLQFNLLFLLLRVSCIFRNYHWIAFQDICPASVRSHFVGFSCDEKTVILFQKFYRSRQGYIHTTSLSNFPHLLSTSCITLQLSLNRNNGLLLLPSTWVSFDPVPPNATPSNVKTVHMKREGIVAPPHPFSRHNTAPDETETSIRMLEDYTRIFMRGAPR
jgi:hypothetical protein